MLDRDEDMLISGTRHPFLFKYKVGFNDAGLIKVVKLHIYNNGGCSYDLSAPVNNNTINLRKLLFIQNFTYNAYVKLLHIMLMWNYENESLF